MEDTQELPDTTGALERYLGNAVRELRQRHGLTLSLIHI